MTTKQVWIKVSPDTTRFARQLQSDLRKIESRARSVRVQVVADNKSLRELKARISALRPRLTVDPSVANNALTKLQASLQSRRFTLPVSPNAATAGFNARMAALLRPRKLDILLNPVGGGAALTGLKSAAAASAAGLLVAASGAVSLTASLTRAVAVAGLLGPAIASASGVALAALGGLASGTANMVGGIQAVLAGAAVLPGALATAGVAIFGITSALATYGTKLGDIGAQYVELKSIIGDAAWSSGGASVLSSMATLLPVLRTGFRDLGNAVGQMFAGIAATVSSSSGLFAIATILENTSSTVSEMTGAVSALVSGFLTLAAAGSNTMPGLAEMATRAAESFDRWASAVTKSGQFESWLTNAGRQLSLLISLSQDLWQSLGNIGRAMGAGSGEAGFGPLAASLQRLNDYTNGPLFQGRMGTLFGGAREATDILAASFGRLGDSLGGLIPTFSQLMILSSQGIGALVDSLASVASLPSTAEALTTVFTGTSLGLQALAPSLGYLQQIFVAIAPLIAQLAQGLGTAVTTILSLIAPLIETVAPALTSVLPVIGAAIVQMLSGLAPLGQLFAAMIPSFMLMANSIVPALAYAFQQLAPVITLLPQIIAPLLPMLTVLINSVLAILPDLVGTLAVAFIQLVQGLLPAVQHVMPALVQLVLALLPVIINMVPAIVGLAQAFAAMVPVLIQSVLPALISLLTWVTNFVTENPELVATIMALIGALLVVVPIVTALFSAFMAVVGVVKIVAAAIIFLASPVGMVVIAIAALIAIIAVLYANSEGIGEALRNFGGGIKDFFVGVKDAIAGVLESVVSFLRDTAANVGDFFIGMFRSFTSGLNSAREGVAGAVTAIQDALSSGLDLAGRFFESGTNIIRGLINGIKSGASGAVDLVRSLGDRLASGFNAVLGIHSPSRVFENSGMNTGQGYINGVKKIAPKVSSAVDSMVSIPSDAELAASRGGTGGGTMGGGSPQQVNNIYYPKAERYDEAVRNKSEEIGSL